MDVQFLTSSVDYTARLVADAEDSLARVIRKKERLLTDEVAKVDVQILEAQEKVLSAQAEHENFKAQLNAALAAEVGEGDGGV